MVGFAFTLLGVPLALVSFRSFAHSLLLGIGDWRQRLFEIGSLTGHGNLGGCINFLTRDDLIMNNDGRFFLRN